MILPQFRDRRIVRDVFEIEDRFFAAKTVRLVLYYHLPEDCAECLGVVKFVRSEDEMSRLSVGMTMGGRLCDNQQRGEKWTHIL